MTDFLSINPAVSLAGQGKQPVSSGDGSTKSGNLPAIHNGRMQAAHGAPHLPRRETGCFIGPWGLHLAPLLF
jgi:hypothetical protein